MSVALVLLPPAARGAVRQVNGEVSWLAPVLREAPVSFSVAPVCLTEQEAGVAAVEVFSTTGVLFFRLLVLRKGVELCWLLLPGVLGHSVGVVGWREDSAPALSGVLGVLSFVVSSLVARSFGSDGWDSTAAAVKLPFSIAEKVEVSLVISVAGLAVGCLPLLLVLCSPENKLAPEAGCSSLLTRCSVSKHGLLFWV